jgi:cytochrome c-type biogenesis protein CcmE
MSRIDDELEQAARDPNDPGAKDLVSSGSAGGNPAASNPEASNPAASNPEARLGTGSARAGGTGHASRPMAAQGSPAGEGHKRSWGLLAGLGALMVGILVLVFSSKEDSAVYAYSVDDLMAQASELSGRQVRVTGSLVSGTLTRRDRPCEYQFNLQPSRTAAAAGVSPPNAVASATEKSSEYLKVSFPQCVVPDTFRDVKGVAVEVTAEGRVTKEGSLEASKVFAKCPSKYEMRENSAELGKPVQPGGGMPKEEFIPPRLIN